MEFTYPYPEKILVKIKEVEESYISNAELAETLCKELIEIGRQNQDDQLLGFVYYHFALIDYYKNQHRDFQKNLILGLKHQLKASASELLAKSYNVLGTTAMFATNNSQAMDYFMTGLRYAEEQGVRDMIGIINGNIGNIYRDLSDHQSAITYMKRSLEDTERHPDSFNEKISLALLYCNLAACFLDLRELSMADSWFNKIKAEHTVHEDIQVSMNVFEIRYFHKMGDTIQREQALQRLIAFLETADFSWNVFDDIFSLCEFLQEKEQVDSLLQILSALDKMLSESTFTKFRQRSLSYKIYCYQQKGLNQKLSAAYMEHFDLTKQLEQETAIGIKNDIKLREELETVRAEHQKIHSEHLLLVKKSRQDFLTSLPNREWLDDHLSQVFERARDKQVPMALEVLDIDDFKYVNDTLGHQDGDRYLLALSSRLYELFDKEVFCARQGGDEFVIVYENKTKEEVLSIAQELQRDIRRLSLATADSRRNPPLTISQGICQFIPDIGKTIDHYYQLADQALYRVKNQSKNGIYLTSI